MPDQWKTSSVSCPVKSEGTLSVEYVPAVGETAVEPLVASAGTLHADLCPVAWTVRQAGVHGGL